MANMAAVQIEKARLAEVEQGERLRARALEHATIVQRDATDLVLHAQRLGSRVLGRPKSRHRLLPPCGRPSDA
jgi:hypothetical protein